MSGSIRPFEPGCRELVLRRMLLRELLIVPLEYLPTGAPQQG